MNRRFVARCAELFVIYIIVSSCISTEEVNYNWVYYQCTLNKGIELSLSAMKEDGYTNIETKSSNNYTKMIGCFKGDHFTTIICVELRPSGSNCEIRVTALSDYVSYDNTRTDGEPKVDGESPKKRIIVDPYFTSTRTKTAVDRLSGRIDNLINEYIESTK